MTARAAAVLALLACTACKEAPPDPLAEQKKTCGALSAAGQLKKGLTVDACAQQLKAAADAADPSLHAGEILDRLASLTAKGRGGADASHQAALRDAVGALQSLGRPAVQPALARMKASTDPDLRIAVARALVSICIDDCGTGDYSCIVPALLEGATDDKPADVRREAEKGLLRCTGQQFGDDPAAWRKWWSERSARSAPTAAR